MTSGLNGFTFVAHGTTFLDKKLYNLACQRGKKNPQPSQAKLIKVKCDGIK